MGTRIQVLAPLVRSMMVVHRIHVGVPSHQHEQTRHLSNPCGIRSTLLQITMKNNLGLAFMPHRADILILDQPLPKPVGLNSSTPAQQLVHLPLAQFQLHQLKVTMAGGIKRYEYTR